MSSSSSSLTNFCETQPRKSDNYPHFNKWLLVTIPISILMVVSLNLTIDPSGIYETPNFRVLIM